jgi:hypothetical protein
MDLCQRGKFNSETLMQLICFDMAVEFDCQSHGACIVVERAHARGQ